MTRAEKPAIAVNELFVYIFSIQLIVSYAILFLTRVRNFVEQNRENIVGFSKLMHVGMMNEMQSLFNFISNKIPLIHLPTCNLSDLITFVVCAFQRRRLTFLLVNCRFRTQAQR